MTDKITRANATESQNFLWTIHASDLGLPVGHFPDALETDLGNGQRFLKANVSSGGTYVAYKQALGCLRLHVWND